MNNVWVLLGVSLVFVLVLGSLPVDLLYTGVLNLIAFILTHADARTLHPFDIFLLTDNQK